jgi:uncharacterized membrane protein YuzA (DUF378 family)
MGETTRTTRVPDIVALVLLIIGGLNWGLYGLFQVDLVAAVFGNMTVAARAVYVIVGLAALYGFVTIAHLNKPRV